MSNTWININLDQVIENYREITRRLAPGSRCMAVVKADAYGLGAVEVARTLKAEGCEAFAVTHVREGIVLREHGVNGLILVLGPVLQEEWPQALNYDLQLSLSDPLAIPHLQSLSEERKQEVEIQLEIETGMGRTGIHPARIKETLNLLQKAPGVKVAGVFTHLARAAQRDRDYTLAQYESFRKAVAELQEGGITPRWQHVCNSAAFLDYPDWHHDFVRIGTLLTGHYPSPAFAGLIQIRDPWEAKSRITHLQRVPDRTYVGYQSLYRTKGSTQLAVIPVGYADGFGTAPHLTPQGFVDFLKIVVKNLLALMGVYLGQEKVTLKGQVITVAGKIGMQLTVLDVRNIDCKVGDEVTIPLRRTLANPLLERKYWENGIILTKRELKAGISPTHPEYSHNY